MSGSTTPYRPYLARRLPRPVSPVQLRLGGFEVQRGTFARSDHHLMTDRLQSIHLGALRTDLWSNLSDSGLACSTNTDVTADDDSSLYNDWVRNSLAQLKSISPLRTDDARLVIHAKLLQQRLVELHDAAAENGIDWLPASETGLRQFLTTEAVSAMPMLTLRPAGQLRALWEDGSGAQIGIQFDDDALVDYVIFAPIARGKTGRHYGMADQPTARSLITALALRHLLA